MGLFAYERHLERVRFEVNYLKKKNMDIYQPLKVSLGNLSLDKCHQEIIEPGNWKLAQSLS